MALYLVHDDDLSPGYLSASCPLLITLPAEAKKEGPEAIRKWVKLARVPREGEFLNLVAQQEGGCRLSQGDRRMPEGVASLLGVPLAHAGKVFAVLVAMA